MNIKLSTSNEKDKIEVGDIFHDVKNNEFYMLRNEDVYVLANLSGNGKTFFYSSFSEIQLNIRKAINDGKFTYYPISKYDLVISPKF